MKHHPYSELFPLLEGSQLDDLAELIKEHGLLHKGWTYKGTLLDGRNREAACKIAKVKFETREYRGKDPLGFVIAQNAEGRRHLSTSERAAIAAKIASLRKGAHASNEAPSQVEAARKMGVSRSSVQRAARKSAPAAPKKQPKEAESWTVEDLKEDGELMNAFKLIGTIYGHDDTRAIRTGSVGMKRADILYLVKLGTEKMKELQDLIFANHWTPARAMKFLANMPDDDTTIGDLKNYCLATKGNFFTGEFGGFTVTMKANSAAKR